jgi:hypothetical protein
MKWRGTPTSPTPTDCTRRSTCSRWPRCARAATAFTSTCAAHDQAEARVAAALAAGGTLVSDRFAPMWWTLADPEGNEVDLATWIGRD